jgi:predicted transcriptional regulator
MPTSVLLSIKPQYAEAILDGRKTFELRRKIFRNRSVNTMVIYSSSPVQRVVGEVEIQEVLEAAPDDLWEKTSDGAAVEREFFDQYFAERKTGYAVRVTRPQRYDKPRSLSEHYGLARPPQSFCYLTA